MLLNLNPEPTWMSCEDVLHVACVEASLVPGVSSNSLSASSTTSGLSSPVGDSDRDRDRDREE